MERYSIAKYLPDTALTAEHPRSVKMRELLENAAKDAGGELITFEVDEGVATVEIKPDAAVLAVIEEIKKLDGVAVSKVSPFEDQYRRNKAQQTKIDTKREKKKAKAIK